MFHLIASVIVGGVCVYVCVCLVELPQIHPTSLSSQKLELNPGFSVS